MQASFKPEKIKCYNDNSTQMNLIVVPVVAKKGYRPGKIIIKFLLHFLIYAKIIICVY